MTPLALLAGCPTGAVSPPSALGGLWNPGMVEMALLRFNSISQSIENEAGSSFDNVWSHSRTRHDAPDYVGS
ncbi:hypothetical protein BDV39DRAFT_77666 [Aspergillus sergii]|uniref:Uncharacterized protein n=1 Tax=Aspergillus sergii TaxID=1034303 RepID=A0A5N6X356_9EURO|nr:hypothetical protein BDV39DRAFT_77666 [Aspergillus sergii]